jgi:hypothetical protein
MLRIADSARIRWQSSWPCSARLMDQFCSLWLQSSSEVCRKRIDQRDGLSSSLASAR